MKLTILGSGGALYNPKRGFPGYFLEIGEDKILIDAGPGTLAKLTKAEIDYFNLTHILISHPHADHISELMAILMNIYMNTFPVYGDKERTKPIIVLGPPGFKKTYQQLKKIMFPEDEKKNIKIEIRELNNSRLKFKNWQLESIINRHVPYWKSISTKFKESGTSLVYSGDSAFCPELIKISQNAENLLFDCSALISNEFPQSHLNPQFAAEIANLSKAKLLILTHLYDLDEPTEIKKEVAKVFKGKVHLARDLEKFIL